MLQAGAQFSEKRELFIFGDPKNVQVTQQLALLEKEGDGVKERAIRITQVPEKAKQYKEYKVDTATAFTLILVGKDGGEKFRSNRVTTADELFAIIDAMPMRRLEMRQNKKPRQ